MTAVLSPKDLEMFRQDAKARGEQRLRNAQKLLIDTLGVARPTMIGNLDTLLQNGLDARKFSLQRQVQIVDTGDYVNFEQVTSMLQLFSTQVIPPTQQQQDAGEVVAYSSLKLYVDGNVVTAATIKEIQDALAARLHYNDNREDFYNPVRNLLGTGLRSPNAGAVDEDPGTGPIVAVEGTATDVIDLGPEWNLDPEDLLIVGPGDTQRNFGFGWLSDYAAAPPAQPAGGETGDIFLTLRADGMLWKAIKRS